MNNTNAIEVLEEKIPAVVTRANGLTIRTPDDFSVCLEETKTIKALIKEVKETFADPKEKAWQTHKAIVAAEKKHLDPLEAAEQILKKKMLSWSEEQERIRKAEQERLRKEAEEEERKRRAAFEAEMAEKRRIEDERIAQERAKLEEERKRNEEEAKAKAAALEESGRQQEAELALKRAQAQAYLDGILEEERRRKEDEERRLQEELDRASMEAPVYVPEVVLPEVATPEGFGKAGKWTAVVTDIRMLCRAVSEGRVSVDCVEPNMKVLNKLASALKTNINIPGVRAEEQKIVRVG